MTSPRLSEARAKAGFAGGEARRARAAERNAVLLERLYAMICQAADQNRPAPARAHLKDHFDISSGTLSMLFQQLEAAGKIRRVGPNNQGQRIEIVATGKMTAPNAATPHRASRAALAPKGEQLSPALGMAKLFLQRLGYPVYRAKIVNPRATPDAWVIGDFGTHFTDAALMDFARKKGWGGAA